MVDGLIEGCNGSEDNDESRFCIDSYGSDESEIFISLFFVKGVKICRLYRKSVLILGISGNAVFFLFILVSKLTLFALILFSLFVVISDLLLLLLLNNVMESVNIFIRYSRLDDDFKGLDLLDWSNATLSNVLKLYASLLLLELGDSDSLL